MKIKLKFLELLFVSFCLILVSSSAIIGSQINNQETNELIALLLPDVIIPDDYDTIQEGIDNANLGDFIFVRSGIYKENILINIENLTIIGEDKTNTIIDGNKLLTIHTMEIVSSNVTISDFTITNGWNKNEIYWDISGIRINASNTKIIGNIITENRLGISVLSKTYNHTIKDNIFINDGLMFGNYVYNYHLDLLDFRHTVENNTVNGKPLYYIYDTNDFVVPEDAGQVILVNCTNATIKNLKMNDTDFFITLAGCHNCNIINNTIENTDGELILFLSENNTLQNNTISNSLHGICLDYKSKNNTVRFNEVYDNWIGISSLTGSEDNKIYSNKIYKNKAGIEITTYHLPMKSQNHEIYENEISGSNNGILISGASENLSVYNNTIYKNIIGITIQQSEGNNISKNMLFKNIISASFSDCTTNIWNNNYWNRPRILPKLIYGYRTFGNLPVPWINVDWNPSHSR